MFELTDQQRQVVQTNPLPLRLIDPQTNKVYVLLTEEVYQQMKHAPEEIDPSFYDVLDLPISKNPKG